MRNLKKILSIMFCFLFIVCLLTSFSGAAAEKIGDAYKPSMNINFAGIENPAPFSINGKLYPSAVNVNGTNYFAGRVLEAAGGTASYINGTSIYTLPNMGNTDACSEASKAVTYLFKQGKQVGNGFFPTELGGTEFVISKNAWNQSHIVKDYKGDLIPINPVPVKITDRLVWLKTNGYKSPYTLPIATVEPKSGDASNLITSINCIPNMINYSTVKDYYDFNVFTTGDKRYLRTYNNSEQSCEGSPTVNENCEVIGVYMWRGANYSLFVDLDDIRGFLNLN